MNDNARREKLTGLAESVLDLSRDRVLGELSFLAAALTKYKLRELTPELRELVKGKLASDYEFLCFDPVKIIKEYKADEKNVTRVYLHSVLHGLFQHMFVPAGVERACWDLACDIAVEAVIYELSLNCTNTGIDDFSEFIGIVLACVQENKKTADAIYRYYMEKGVSPQKMAAERAVVYGDDHSLWYLSDKERQQLLGSGSQEKKDEARSRWEKVSLTTEAEYARYCATNKYGSRSACFTRSIKKVTREKYDYTDFLRQFAVPYEAMKVNMDEFDYVYYTYGMELYENIPLIEPLEYKEDKKIRDFVIAIDTSASVDGELVQSFIQKTYNILKSSDSFSRKANIYLIQCDAEIQSVLRLNSIDDVEKCIDELVLKGFGGTDFRPVFKYVDELIENGELANLEGIIYFTDAYGPFPDMPNYKAAFVLIEDEESDFNGSLPPWAIKLVLSKEELSE